MKQSQFYTIKIIEPISQSFVEKRCALPHSLFIPTCNFFYICTFCSIVTYFTNISKRSIKMYVQERLENWKNYVPAARALANVIKWYTHYTEPMQQRTRAASKYCRFYIESITSCPGSTDSDFLSYEILFFNDFLSFLFDSS